MSLSCGIPATFTDIYEVKRLRSPISYLLHLLQTNSGPREPTAATSIQNNSGLPQGLRVGSDAFVTSETREGENANLHYRREWLYWRRGCISPYRRRPYGSRSRSQQGEGRRGCSVRRRSSGWIA